MSRADQDLIRVGVERHLAGVESLIPARSPWRVIGDHDVSPALVRVVAGPAVRERARGNRRSGLLVAVAATVGVILAYGLLGGGSRPSLVPSDPTASTSAAAPATSTSVTGELRPAVEPRLILPVRPKSPWTVIDDGVPHLGLVHFLDDVGSGGYNVAFSVFEPLGVYDPVVETKRLPLPADLIRWISDHPDLDSEQPVQLTVAGLPARAIDATVTYQAGGPKGETAQFIHGGFGSWNLEFPAKKRFVLIELPDRPLLIVFGSRPEFFDATIRQFEDELALIRFEDRGVSP